MSTYVTSDTLLSPSNVLRRLESRQISGLSPKKKQVRFRADVSVRLRPSASNLRPLCRLAKKESGDISTGGEGFIHALDSWDLDWRQYLHLFYDTDMVLVSPCTEGGFREYISFRERLVILGEDCKRAYRHWLAQVQPSEQLMIERIGDAELQAHLRRLLAARTHVLQRVLFAVDSWPSVEERRWRLAACPPTAEMQDSHAAVHETFCDFVDRIDALQRKYKALSDSIRRVQRKARKLAKPAQEHQDLLSPFATPIPTALLAA